MIVWLASHMRSGNTYTRILLHHLCECNTYSVYKEKQNKLSQYLGHVDIKPDLEQYHKSSKIHFVKTHYGPHQHYPKYPGPVLHIVRDGRDCYVSRAHHFINQRGLKRKVKFVNVLENMVKSGAWSKHAKAWSSIPNRSVVKYENLVKNPQQTIKDAIKELDLDIEVKNNKFPSFEELKPTKKGNFFRRGISGSWRDEMPKKIEKLFWKHNSIGMDILGYSK